MQIEIRPYGKQNGQVTYDVFRVDGAHKIMLMSASREFWLEVCGAVEAYMAALGDPENATESN